MFATTLPAAVDSMSERATTITPKGQAVLALYRFVRMLEEFSGGDRRDVLSLLGQEVTTPAATGWLC